MVCLFFFCLYHTLASAKTRSVNAQLDITDSFCYYLLVLPTTSAHSVDIVQVSDAHGNINIELEIMRLSVYNIHDL
jgi:hypothetical protein